MYAPDGSTAHEGGALPSIPASWSWAARGNEGRSQTPAAGRFINGWWHAWNFSGGDVSIEWTQPVVHFLIDGRWQRATLPTPGEQSHWTAWVTPPFQMHGSLGGTRTTDGMAFRLSSRIPEFAHGAWNSMGARRLHVPGNVKAVSIQTVARLVGPGAATARVLAGASSDIYGAERDAGTTSNPSMGIPRYQFMPAGGRPIVLGYHGLPAADLAANPPPSIAVPASWGGSAAPRTGPVAAPTDYSGDRLTDVQLAALALEVGFGKFGDEVVTRFVATLLHESGGRVRAVNPRSGAAGLAQVMPDNYRRLGGDPFDPRQNLRMALTLAEQRVAQQRDPLGPWESYTTGRYEQNMERATAAMRQARTGTAPAMECVAQTQTDFPEGRPGAWGGHTNGQIPAEAICVLASAPGLSLRCDAAAAFDRMSQAMAAEFGRRLCVTDAYRTRASQEVLYRIKPHLAAVPGTSNHGWGLAVDLCGGVQSEGNPAHEWMELNAGRFGWFNPQWAQSRRIEPWHWEFGSPY